MRNCNDDKSIQLTRIQILLTHAHSCSCLANLLATQTSHVRYKTVTEENAVDAVIPMTHQYIPQDRTLAKMKVGFPLLLGGHDHELYYEVVEGCHIVKTGMDGSTIAIIDVTWADSSSTKPEITVVMKESKSYARDPILEEAIERHKQVLKSLVSND